MLQCEYTPNMKKAPEIVNKNPFLFHAQKQSLAGHNGQIDCVKFAYTDNYVYSADEHGIIKRWDLNGQLAACSTFYGHMKSVRTLDFHPYGELVASGSNDTSVRLWDVRKDNACISTFRAHIANVNSVRFSPDGSWIASAGTEGCLIIWDIRTGKHIIQFQEHASPITCIQFHPFEFLIAAGRNDGTVDLYDLESQKLISRTDGHSAFSGHTVKAVAFSESGECLFVGTADGISVIGWEPGREFDHIEGSWSILGDMKVLTKKVYCASYENQTVQIHDILVEQVIPFYNPSNQPFSYNQSSRKSFTRAGSAGQRLNLSTGKKAGGGGSPGKTVAKALQQQRPLHGAIPEVTAAATSAAASAIDRSSPQSLSFEMIDEEAPVQLKNGFHFETYAKRRSNSMFVGSPTSSASEEPAGPSHYGLDTPPTSMPLTLNAQHDADEDRHYIDHYANADLDYYPQRSGGGLGATVAEPEREDFPINSATPPDYAPKIDIVAHQLSKQQQQQNKHKSTGTAATHSNAPLARRHSPPGLSTHQAPRVAALSRKFTSHSLSTMDLHQASSDDSLPAVPRRNAGAQTTTTRNYMAAYAGSNNNHHQQHNNQQHHQQQQQHNNNGHNGNGTVKMRRETTTTTSHYNRENNIRSKKISVQIYEAPPPKAQPMRSKTSLDLRSAASRTSAPSSPTTKRRTMYNNGHGSQQHEENAYQMLAGQHEQVMGHLAHRLAMLKSLSRTADVTETLRQAVKLGDPALLVDLFGVMLETNS